MLSVEYSVEYLLSMINSASIMESPMISARTNEFVERTIEQTISEHIFGGLLDFNQSSTSHDVSNSSRRSSVDGEFDGHSADPPQGLYIMAFFLIC